jgi:hypothetical protein
VTDELKGEKKVHFLYQAPDPVPGESYLGEKTSREPGVARLEAAPAEGCGGLQTHTSQVMVPVEPHLGVLVSMAVCLDHGFGLLSPERQEAKLYDMRKLYNEVVGRGYYSPERNEFYQGFVSTVTRAAFPEQRSGEWEPVCD